MKKKFYVALLAFSLAMICANFIIRRVGVLLSPPAQGEIAEQEFSPFGLVKQTEAEDRAKSPYFPKIKEQELEFQEQKEIVRPVFQIELTDEEQKTVENYSQNPKMQEFVQELSKVISKEELEQENYLKIAFKPEVRAIFMKYSQDKEFREIAATIMKDKNLLQLAKRVVNTEEAKK